MSRALYRFWCDEAGTATVEYALLLVVIVVGSLGAWTGLRDKMIEALQGVQDSISE